MLSLSRGTTRRPGALAATLAGLSPPPPPPTRRGGAARLLSATRTFQGPPGAVDPVRPSPQTSAFFESSNSEYPLSLGQADGVVLYDGAAIAASLAESPLSHRCPRYDAFASEWVRVLDTGPGVMVVKGAFADHATLDGVSRAFEAIVAAERAGSDSNAGDHFSAAGNNSRIWNALEKLAVEAPDLFTAYYNNVVMDAVSTAWLGPHWQMTSQVNSSHPGSAAQDPHCDYHLGFRSDEECARYPAHVHAMSQYLTLQVASARPRLVTRTIAGASCS